MKKKLFLYIPLGILAIGILILGVYLYNFFLQPFGESMTLVPRGMEAAATQAEAGSESSISSTGRIVCGQRGAYTILAIGSDAEEMRGVPGSDLTRLVRIDFSNKKISTFALPRDLWVDVGLMGFHDPVVTETTLGKTYYLAYEQSAHIEEHDKIADAVQASAQMILDNFDVKSDHYFMLDLDQLPALVDAIGGLPINIPEQITDPWIGVVIEAGPQTLTGDQLRAYARAIPDSDLARIQRSDLIIQALQEKLLDPKVWVKLPSLYDMFAKKMIVTDLSPLQVFNIFCLIREIPREEIVMDGIRPEWTSPGPSNSLLWDKDAINLVLKQMELIR